MLLQNQRKNTKSQYFNKIQKIFSTTNHDINCPSMQEFAYLFVILNGSSGIFMFIHSVILNEVVMQELRIRLRIDRKDSMAVDRSSSGLNAVKVCRSLKGQ